MGKGGARIGKGETRSGGWPGIWTQVGTSLLGGGQSRASTEVAGTEAMCRKAEEL